MPVKYVYVAMRASAMSEAAFHDYWLNVHGPMVKGLAAAFGARRYVQSHTITPQLAHSLTDGRDLAPDPDGLTEAWLDSIDDLARTPTRAALHATATMIEDERRFVDLSRSRCFLTQEVEIFVR